MSIRQSLHWLDLLVIATYLISVVGVGFWVSLRRSHTQDLFLAGRRFGWFYIGLSIFGTNVSPAMMIGSCGVAYSSGMVASNFEWLAWVFLFLLAMLFLPHYLNTHVATMPDFLERRFGKSCREVLSCYVLFSTLWLWIGSALYAGSVLLTQLLDWPLWMSAVFLGVISTSFTMIGGLEAVIITDSFQSLLIIFASAMLTVIGLAKVGSIDTLVSSVPRDFWILFRPSSDATYPWHAVLLGYPVLGIWFWCTDQTIVQRVLGGRNLQEGQYGAVFASALKIITPLIFFVPGILCRVLHPSLEKADQAYMVMVTQHLPTGMVGLIVAVLIAALVTTLDAGLNSFSTVFTLDIYQRHLRKTATSREIRRVGQITTGVIGLLGILCAIVLSQIEMNLFELGQSMISFLAPSMAAVFLIGVSWRRATSAAALFVLVIGNLISIGIGVCYLAKWPLDFSHIHFLLLAFYLFVAMSLIMFVVSLFTRPPDRSLPTLAETYRQLGTQNRRVWVMWGAIAICMLGIYLFFNRGILE